MDPYTVIKIGGFYNMGFLVFHAMFWKLFNWKNELPRLTHINAAVMQVLNLCLMFCFLLFAYISLFHTSELGTSSMGRVLLLSIALFWLIRAIEQLVFFSFRRPLSIAMTILFLLGFCLYAYPLIRI
ncbi:MAG: hypothetical protein NT010_16035 [Proteobacteria bacterium]|nr:hypothetical protein [Pseudomonadota bacterium]